MEKNREEGDIDSRQDRVEMPENEYVFYPIFRSLLAIKHVHTYVGTWLDLRCRVCCTPWIQTRETGCSATHNPRTRRLNYAASSLVARCGHLSSIST